MTTITIFSDSLGTDNATHNDRYIRFLNACAKQIDADVEFEWTAKTSGVNSSCTDEFQNYVWNNINWFGRGPFRKADIERASKILKAMFENEEN